MYISRSIHYLIRKAVVVGLLLFAWTAQCAGVPEYDAKAGFLFNFSRFIEWERSDSSESSKPFVFGVYGDNPFGESIFLLEQQSIRGRAVVVRIIPEGSVDFSDCQMLFVPASQKNRTREIVDLLKSKPIVLVGESPGFAQVGGMINFYLKDERIAFEINLESFKSSRLSISSRLLRLAQVINGDDY